MRKLFLLTVLAFSMVNAFAENRIASVSANQFENLTDTLTDAIPYYIGVSSNPTVGGSTTGAGAYYNGQTCTLTATPNQGYVFANWTEDGNPQTSNPVYSFIVTENRDLVANFSPQTFTISAYSDPYVGGSVTGAGDYGYMQTCTLTATANPGYTFVCWKEGEANVSNDPTYSFTVTANRNLVATFVQQTYVISVTVNPTNAGTVSGSGTYYYNQLCTLTATPETGYDFVCWKENGSPVSNNLTYSFTVTSARNLEAFFAPKSYVISSTVNPTESGTVTGTGTYLFNETCTLTATANTGYVFVSWTENGAPVSTEPTYVFTVTGNRNLVANFALASYEISVSINPTIAGDVVGSGSYLYGQTCTLIASENTGYTFSFWSENGNTVSYDAQYSFTVTASRNLVANFTPMEFQISVSAQPTNGGVVDGGDTYYYGQVCTVTAEANYGYNFINWTEDGLQVASNSTYEFTVTDNRNLVANFSANTYIIHVDVEPENGGTISGAGGYGYGDVCTLEAYPDPCYVFDGWYENGELISTQPNYTFIVDGSHDIVARFSVINYSLEIEYNSEMGIAYGEGRYDCGTMCTITAVPYEHYHFVHWLLEDEVFSTDSVYTFEMTQDYNLIAVFEKALYEVEVTIDPEGAGEVIGTGFYAFGDTVTLCAEGYENYYFMHWIVNDSVVSEDLCYTFVLEEPVDIVASFVYDDAVSESLSAAIALYPNPVYDALQIEGEDINTLRIYNVYGQLMDVVNVAKQSIIRLEVGHYQPGTYILMLDTDLGVAVKRFVKQ